MVTNTAGTTADVPTAKENGECKQGDEVSDENAKARVNSNNNIKSNETEQTSCTQKPDSDAMSSSQKISENSSANVMAGNSGYTSNPRAFGNGLPATLNSDPVYVGHRPMQSGSNYLSMQPRYPGNQQPPAATPTLNQLLTTPTRPPSQYPGYGIQPSQQEFGQAQQQNWSTKMQHDRATGEQYQPEPNSYPPQQQSYPASQQHSNYPSPYARFPSPGSSQVPYNHPHQQNSYNSTMMPPGGQSGYPPANPTASARHPNYSNYPNYTQQSVYYAPRPPLENFPESQQQSASQMQDKLYQQQKETMMSPNRRTPQPAPSPMNATQQAHPGHPSVAHFRGPPSAPGSPSVTSRGTPLSPASVRSDAPQPPMRPGSGHSEHSNPPAPSPLSAGAGSSAYGSYSSRPNYAWKQQQSNFPQHMMSPQPSSNQPDNITQGVTGMRSSGPPSVGKPASSTPQVYSQSQASPGFSQSGGNMPYYDNAPQHLMQGYTSASPAPSERRPSRQGSQGSQTPNLPTPEPSGRQGAAAAAAAAMAAAAHTAHSGNVVNQKPPAPVYYPPSQPPRPQHPNYNNLQQQAMDVNQQNLNYPRMAHTGVPGSAPQRLMGPPVMAPQTNQGGYRMPPPSQYSSGYSQPVGPVPQQGHYPGYYMQGGPGDPNQPRGPRPNFHTSPGYQQPHAADEPTPKKPANRTASQKLNALYEPEEPGRRDFVEGLLRYWEEKDVPLKNAPLMGRKTLDLFKLFHIIKERGGMQEVTANKKWSEISTILGMGSTSTSGFTLKKQYCKYLYGYECKERGVPEPQEALARVNEANRKRKQALEHPKDGIVPQAPRMHHPNHLGNPYPSPQFQPNQYGPQYQMPQSHSTPGYVMQPNPTYTNNAYPQHPGQLNTVGAQPGAPPVLSFPSVPPNARQWPPPGRGPAPIISEPGLVQVENHNGAPKSLPPSQSDVAAAASGIHPNQSIRPPVPPSGTVAAANPFNESSLQPPTTVSQTPPSFPNHLDQSKQTFTPRAPQDPLRPTPPPRPGMMPNQYPYSNSPMSHPSPVRGPADIRGAPSPGPRTPYQPNPPLSTRPMTSVPHQMTGRAYAGNSYIGVKRRSTENYGPPRKLLRPDDPSQSYAGNPPYRPRTELLRHRFSPDTPSSAYRPLGAPMAPSPHPSLHGYESHRFPKYMSRRRQHHYPPGNRFSALKNRLQSHHALSPLPQHSHDPRPTLKRQLQLPARSVTHVKREMALFPADSIEATPLRLTKFQRKSCNNVGLIEGWRLIMSLKSGLLVESSWALNSLNILLYDQRSVAQLRLSQLPGLLDTIVEHFRRFLSEMFMFTAEKKALGVPFRNEEPISEDIDIDDVFLSGKQKQVKKKRKGSHVPRYKKKNAPYKVKFEQRPEPFLTDNSHKWDSCDKVDVSDDLSHIILSLSQPLQEENTVQPAEEYKKKENSVRCVEATLEDVLSIPCSIISPHLYDISKTSLSSAEKSKDLTKNEDLKEELAKKKAALSYSKTAMKKRLSSIEKDGASQKIRVEDSDMEENKTFSTKTADFKTSRATSETCSSKSKRKCSSNMDTSETKLDSSVSKIDQGVKNPAICNGLQINFSLHNEKVSLNKEKSSHDDSGNLSIKCENQEKTCSEKRVPENPTQLSSPEVASLSVKVKQLLKDKNVVILEDEAAGSDGCLSDALAGPLFSSKSTFHRKEMSNHLLTISNVIRNLSFIPSNMDELVRQKHLMKVLSGILLLRHKHKIRKRSSLSSDSLEQNDPINSKETSDEHKTVEEQKVLHELKNNKIIHDKTNDKINCGKVSLRRFSKVPTQKAASELFAPEEPPTPKQESPKNYVFSSTVFVDEFDDSVFKDPWWWDYVRSLREDALTIFANVAPCLDLSLFLDDSIPLAILEGCLHWVTCPSSDACDAFSHKPNNPVSPQRLSIEILTKLSIKDQNVDLILASRPYCKLEKLFNYLVSAVGNKRDKIMRELSVVLLSNLSRGDPGAARAIALQGAAIGNLISFLEDCEECGMNSRPMYPELINCGTTVFMMAKAAKTLLSMAAVSENKTSFVKYQLRLLSLSMSECLGPLVTSIISSVLFEITHVST